MIGEEGQTILNLSETLKLRLLQSIVELVAVNVWAKTLVTLLPKTELLNLDLVKAIYLGHTR